MWEGEGNRRPSEMQMNSCCSLNMLSNAKQYERERLGAQLSVYLGTHKGRVWGDIVTSSGAISLLNYHLLL